MIRSVLTSRYYKWWAFGAVAMGIFLTVLDQASLNIAIPEMATHFGTDIPTAQWVLLAYILAISAVLMPVGRLSDIVGRKRVYIAGLGFLIVGGVLGFFANSLSMVIILKALQGVGNGMLTANNMAILAAVFPPEERGKGMGLLNTTVGIGSIAGPTIGGQLVTSFGWGSIFILTAAVGVITVGTVYLILDEARIAPDRNSNTRLKFDWFGAGLSSAGLVFLLLALSFGESIGWMSVLVLGGIVGFVILFGGFIVWELKSRSPMLDLGLFRRKVFTLGIITRGMGMLAGSPVAFLMPFYLQGVLGYSAGQSGLIIVFNSAGMAAAAFICGNLSDRIGWKPFIAGGLGLITIGVAILSRLTPTSPPALAIGGLILAGVGQGMFISPNLNAVIGAVEREKHGVTTALVNLVRTATNLIGVAAATAIVTAMMVSRGVEPRLKATGAEDASVASAFSGGMSIAYMVMAVCAFVGFVAAMLMKQRREDIGR
jgi:EmrB/QacA subfamily drug resistance transporter